MRQSQAALNIALLILISIFSVKTVLNFSAPVLAETQINLVGTYINQEKPKLYSKRFSKIKFLDKESDLYLTLLNEYVFKSQKKAFRSVKPVRGLLGNSLDSAINLDSSEQEDLQLEREFFKLWAKHEAEIIALEIFVNNSLEDAEFDLVKDLSRIEKMLFDEESESKFEASMGRSSTNLAEIGEASESLSGYTSGATEESQNEDNADTETQIEIDLASESPIIIQDGICQLDQDLVASLETYNDEIEQAAINQAEDSSETDSSETSSDGSGASARGGRLPLSSIEQEERGCPDGAMFCVTTEKIYKIRNSYTVSDRDCINCLIEELNAKTDDLLGESIAAHELPGEPFQPNLNLKSFALNSIKMEFKLIKKPLAYPSETDILTESSPSDLITQAQEARSVSVSSDTDVADATIRSTNDLPEGIGAVGEAAVEATEEEANQEIIRSYFAEVQAEIDANEALVFALTTRMQASLNYYQGLNTALLNISTNMSEAQDKDDCN